MNLHTIRGGTKEDLESRKYTIGVGISLGNKWFNIENILSLIEWSLIHSRDKVVVYVADSIHALNIEARSGVNKEKALQKALALGEEILGSVKEKADILFNEDENKRIEYVHWDKIKDEKYNLKLDFLYNYYNNNSDFKDKILEIIKKHISKEDRVFSDTSLEKMAYYVLEEMPECISRVKIGSLSCDAYVYPMDAMLPEFIEKLQKGLIFPDIKQNIMDTEPKVFLEVR